MALASRRLPLIALLCCACGGGGGGGDGNEVPLEAASSRVLDMEDRVAAGINSQRANHSVAPLVHDDALRRVARRHSQDMLRRNFFDHVNPDGLDPFDRMAEESIEFFAAGENIAWNRGYAEPDVVAVTGWMNSDGHRRNILNATYTHAGLGAAYDEASGSWFFTQLFALPAGRLLAMTWVEREATALPTGNAEGSSWIME